MMMFFNFITDFKFLFLEISFLILIIAILFDHSLSRTLFANVYKIKSKMEWYFGLFILIMFVLFIILIRLGRRLLQSDEINVINIWDILNKTSIYLETISTKYDFIIHIIIIIHFLILLKTIIAIIKYHLMKMYIYLHKYNIIVTLLDQVVFNNWLHEPLDRFFVNMRVNEGPYKAVYNYIGFHYFKYNFRFVLLAGLVIISLCDIYYNDGTLIFIHNIMPYYVVLITFINFYIFVKTRQPRFDSIIADCYYSFHNPRLNYFEYSELGMHTVTRMYGIKLTKKQINNFRSYTYNVYRIVACPNEAMEYHILTDDLFPNEVWERLLILRRLGLLTDEIYNRYYFYLNLPENKYYKQLLRMWRHNKNTH